MIDLYYCPTPNCQKISIALEELELPYQVCPIDIVAGDQNEPSYAAICPNRKVPAIVDHDGPDGQPITLWESGAILLYLAEKTRRLLIGILIHCGPAFWPYFERLSNIQPQFSPTDLARDARADPFVVAGFKWPPILHGFG